MFCTRVHYEKLTADSLITSIRACPYPIASWGGSDTQPTGTL